MPIPAPIPTTSPTHQAPCKVLSGTKLASDDWAARLPRVLGRLLRLRLVEQAAPGTAMVAGLEYAKLGQTRTPCSSPADP
jgi:hypothetical protein